jgi:PAS domain S-box-containing protein
LLGYKREEILGTNWFSNYLPKNLSETVKEAFTLLITGRSLPKVEYYENPVLTKSGEERIIEWHNSIFRDPKGKILKIISSGKDKTDIKEIEKTKSKLIELTSILDGLPLAIYVSDPYTYEIVYVNKQMCNLYKNKPLIGEKCYEVLQGRSKPCDFCTLDTLFKNPTEPYTWKFHNPQLNRDFLITDNFIDWPDGRKLKLEQALSFTEINQA